MKTKNKYMGWWQKPITMVRGSTYIITAVPLQNQSDGHWIGGPLQLKALIRLYVRVLARKVAHLSQGTLRTAISARLDRIGTWLARFQPCLVVRLEWVGRIPLLFLACSAPTRSCTLPCGVWTRMPKTRSNAVFRRRAV